MPMEITFGTVRFRAARMRTLVDDVRRALGAFDAFLQP
jgi:hypothetical protein